MPLDCTGLQRLETLRRSGAYLFQGDRPREGAREIYPVSERVCLDPSCIRGLWVPAVGVLPPVPLVKDVFASPWVAAMASFAGRRSFRLSEFADGTVSFTVGENWSTYGQSRRLLDESKSLDGASELSGYSVTVFQRRYFPEDRLRYPFPGMFVSPVQVPVAEQVSLTVGDLRTLASCANSQPLDFDCSEVQQAAHFEGPFCSGGQIRFCPQGGERLAGRIPKKVDRQAAHERSGESGFAWIARHGSRLLLRPYLAAALPTPRYDSSGTGTLRRALTHIDENLGQSLSVEEIAGAAGMSRSRLHLAFQRHLGCTPMELVVDRRLDMAQQLLEETDLSVATISERCGFSQQSSLTRRMKMRRGLTPMGYRQAQHRSKTR